MTVIAVRKYDNGDIKIASDSMVSDSEHVILSTQFVEPKIKTVNGITFGSAGTAGHASIFEMYLEEIEDPEPTKQGVINLMVGFDVWMENEGYTPDPDCEGQYILIIDGHVFQTYNPLDTYEVEKFSAIGSGATAALAAMIMGASPCKAVSVACELDKHCRPPIDSRLIHAPANPENSLSTASLKQTIDAFENAGRDAAKVISKIASEMTDYQGRQKPPSHPRDRCLTREEMPTVKLNTDMLRIPGISDMERLDESQIVEIMSRVINHRGADHGNPER